MAGLTACPAEVRKSAVVPLRQFVLKVHSRCNLACDHCYVYEHVDQSWRRQPPGMAMETVQAAARRISQHAALHRIGRVTIVLHGGEPLLVGAYRLREALAEIRSTIEPAASVHLRIQSNGLLLTEAICDVLAEFDVRIGISLDGDQVANDRHRRFAHGGSSFAGVLRGLRLLRRSEYRHTFGGLLCTIDIRNDPIAVYEGLLTQQPPRLDFLLPHATWDEPPSRPPGGDAAYGRWLAAVYRRWMTDGRPVPIRLFDSLISAGAGGPSASEWVGLDPVDLAVIETDGAWEQVDSLKTAYDGAAHTGLNVFEHTVDDVAAHPGIRHRQGRLDSLCDTCRQCPIVRQCGGGLLAHRFRSGNAFDNPTVYCADIKELVATMNEPADPLMRVLDDLATGYGGAATVGYLADLQYAMTRALVVAVGECDDLAAPAKGGWNLLCHIDSIEPGAVQAVLSHPYVRVWAVRYLTPTSTEQHRRHAEALQLNSLAAAAAILAGADAEIPIAMRDGRVVLPSLGAVVLGEAGDGTAIISTSAAGFALRVDGVNVAVPRYGIRGVASPGRAGVAQPADWRPYQRIDLDGHGVHLDDQDPHRDCHHWPAAAELSSGQVKSWRGSLAHAWRLIKDEVPGQLPGVHKGLTLVTPLQPDPGGSRRSATARHAFGAVAVAPADGPELAEMLVHELQHVKLGALLDVVDLFDPTYAGALTVAWRTDARPIEGVLQGTYAHLALADLWWRRAQADGPGQALAVREFRRCRDWTTAALDTMLATPALTGAGHRFVARMAITMAGWAM